MRLKRILSLGLATALSCSLLVAPIPAAAATARPSFGDISDATVLEAAETLRVLGIIDGVSSNSFQPGSILTRAQFTKMAVEIMDKGDLVAGQMNRTIFKDVPATHWARGYINVATQASSTGGDKDNPTVITPGIIRGDAYGNFSPDKAITYAEAITILVRILGYSDTDVGLMWPQGYLSMADSLALTDGAKLQAGDTLTRGQAALLLENLLYINPKGSKTEYLVSALKCTVTEETIVFSVEAVAPDGSQNAVKTSDDKIYQTQRPAFPEDLVGRRAKLVLDADGEAVAAQVTKVGTQKVIGILSTGYNFLKLSGGEELKVSDPAKVTVYRDGLAKDTYDKAYLNLTAGTQAVLQYSAAGELEYMFLRGTSKVDDTTRVLKNKPTASATEPGYKIYKNGLPAATKDYRQYDVTTFDTVSNIMYVSDLRVTGIYENVYPNTQTPAKITIMGRDFDVLPGAAADLANFKLGQNLTLLLTHTGQVAGAVDPSVARSTTVGQVESVDPASGKAVVVAINLRDAGGVPMKFSGTSSYTGDQAKAMEGQLVTVSSGAKQRLSLSKLSGSQTQSPLDVASGRIGTATMAPNARLYEHVDSSAMKEIKLKDLTTSTVPVDKISYIHKNYAGEVDIVVFNNATGDMFDYGFIAFVSAISNPGLENNVNATVSVTNAQKTAGPYDCGIQIHNNAMGGIVAKSGRSTLASYVELKSVSGVRSSAFDMETMKVTTTSAVYPIASNVQCYNRTTGAWFPLGADPTDATYKEVLNQARAFSDTVTIYLDRAPEDGGKIRIVAVG